MPPASRPKQGPVASFTFNPGFPEPTSLEEARTRREHLNAEVREIDGQLANPVRLGQNGQPMELAEFRAWRGRAIAAANTKRNLSALLKLWMDRQTGRAGGEAGSPAVQALQAQQAQQAPGQGELKLLIDVQALLLRLREDGVEYEEEEERLISRLDATVAALKGAM